MEVHMSGESFLKKVHEFFDSPPWLPTLKSEVSYERTHDDDDGSKKGRLSVMFGPDGDAYLMTDTRPGEALRFRTFFGGGRSLRVRDALMILAEAIRLDNEERPEQ